MKARIFLIDDNINLTTLLSKALERSGYEAHAENDSTVATERVRSVKPDLILLDVVMPGKDGGDVLAELRNDPDLRPIPVILLTALAREAAGIARMGGIESQVLSKPIELGALIAAIEANLREAASRVA